MAKIKVLMVCLGNICRSPTAHGVLAHRIAQLGLEHLIEVDSAGTSAWHIDEAPDARSQAVAKKRGYDLSEQRGRQVSPEDFESFDFILAMDRENLHNLRRICPAGFSGHLGLFLDFGTGGQGLEVPDPYHGGPAGFDRVLDLVEDAVDGLLNHIKSLPKRP